MSNDKLITVDLTVEEVNLVLTALAELPAKISMNLISKVSTQAQQQLAANEVDNG